MASKLSRNSLTEKRSRMKPKDQETDALAIEKAAAWAWYHRSSGSEGKAAREFRTTRTQRDHKPSRYKLEAIRMASSQETKEGSYAKKLPLLDAYEVRSILMRLDGLVTESSHDGKLGNGFGSANASMDCNGSGRRRKKKAGKGIWERHGVICSTRKEDVVDGRRGFRESQIQISPNCIPVVRCSMPWG